MSSYYCRLCMTNSVPEECTIFSKTITEMLFYCMPEINVKLVNNPILCGSCKKLLEQSAEFKKKCIDVQNHIEKFKETNRGTLDLALISAANRTVTPQSPVNISFDESYRKFLASSNTENAADSTDDEVSKIMNKAKEEIRKCDDFLNLLESSTNIKKPRVDNVEKSPEIYVPRCKTPKITYPSKPVTVSRSKTPGITKTIALRPKPEESKKSLTMHGIWNPFDVRIENNRCVTCDITFDEIYKLVYHLYNIHQKVDRMYCCLLCRYKVGTWKTLRQHFLTFHKDCIDIHSSCPVCHTHKSDQKTLKAHIRSSHKIISSGSDRFRCDSCTYRTKNMEFLKRHMFQNHDLICNYCQNDFENTESLNRHIRCHYFEQKKKPPVLKDPLELVEVKVEQNSV